MIAGWRTALASLVCAAALGVGPVLAAESETVRGTSGGVELVAKAAPAEADYEIGIVAPQAGLANIRAALELLVNRSPTSAAAIDELIRGGAVTIVYDPRFPRRTAGFSGLRLAAFRHDGEADPASPLRFPVVVGRHGIKWAPAALAFIIAHELVGHGLQHLRGRLGFMRELDSECEAYLYQEIAHQELGLDKRSREMIQFRNALEQRWCSDFRRYLAAREPAAVALWEAMDPDVQALLAAFERYVAVSYPAATARAEARRGERELSSELRE